MLFRTLLMLFFCLTTTSTFGVGTGENAPDWSGTDLLTGSEIQFPEILGDKPAVLVFWATWCPYCKAFMPYVKEIQADYEKYGVQIISFNALERGIGDPRAYAESLNFPFIAIGAADNIAELYEVKYIPGLMVVDANGVVAYRRKSTDLPAGKTVSQLWSEEVREILDKLIEKGSL